MSSASIHSIFFTHRLHSILLLCPRFVHVDIRNTVHNPEFTHAPNGYFPIREFQFRCENVENTPYFGTNLMRYFRLFVWESIHVQCSCSPTENSWLRFGQRFSLLCACAVCTVQCICVNVRLNITHRERLEFMWLFFTVYFICWESDHWKCYQKDVIHVDLVWHTVDWTGCTIAHIHLNLAEKETYRERGREWSPNEKKKKKQSEVRWDY